MDLRKSMVEGSKRAAAIAFPMFATPGTLRRLSPPLLVTLHALLVAAALGGLWWIQAHFDLDRFLRLPAPQLRNLWLPLLFLLIYLLGWAGRWLFSMLGQDEESPVFPDLDETWREAMRALDQAGIDIASAPLFLILGRPQRAEEALFEGVQPRLVVPQSPRRADAPLHVYANREGIYLTCPGASLLGRQAELLAESGTVAAIDEGSPSGEFLVGQFATLAPAAQKASEAVEQILHRAREQGRGVEQLHEEERHALGILATSQAQEELPVRWLLQDRAEAERYATRFRHLCRLLAAERRPFCPINGILIVLPMAVGRSDEAAAQVGQVAQRDLAVVRETLRVSCPVFALVADLENTTGFRELAARLTDDQRGRRMGQRFPLVPDLEPNARARMIEDGVQQIGNRLIPNLVSNLWKVEAGGETGYADALRANIELYHLLGGVRDAQRRIARTLSRAVLPEGAPPEMLGGCYFGATGNDPSRERAFIPGVIRRLVENQDFVAWTAEAVEEDRGFRRWARYGYVALTLAALLAVALVAAQFYRGQPGS